MLDFIKNFLQIKKIIALILTCTFAYLSLKGIISAEQYITIFAMVISFYFGQSSVRQAVTETKTNDTQTTPGA